MLYSVMCSFGLFMYSVCRCEVWSSAGSRSIWSTFTLWTWSRPVVVSLGRLTLRCCGNIGLRCCNLHRSPAGEEEKNTTVETKSQVWLGWQAPRRNPCSFTLSQMRWFGRFLGRLCAGTVSDVRLNTLGNYR